MSSFVAFESQWISLDEHSRSSFAFVSIFYVQVRIFLLSMMPMRATNGKSRLMRAGFRTRTRRRRSVDEGHSPGEENVLHDERITSANFV
jgi:hypothetical protein